MPYFYPSFIWSTHKADFAELSEIHMVFPFVLNWIFQIFLYLNQVTLFLSIPISSFVPTNRVSATKPSNLLTIYIETQHILFIQHDGIQEEGKRRRRRRWRQRWRRRWIVGGLRGRNGRRSRWGGGGVDGESETRTLRRKEGEHESRPAIGSFPSSNCSCVCVCVCVFVSFLYLLLFSR